MPPLTVAAAAAAATLAGLLIPTDTDLLVSVKRPTFRLLTDVAHAEEISMNETDQDVLRKVYTLLESEDDLLSSVFTLVVIKARN